MPTGRCASRDILLEEFDLGTLDDLHEETLSRYACRLKRAFPGDRARRNRLARVAGLLLDGLTERNVPFNRATECDWRLVLYDWMPRCGQVPAHAAALILRRLHPFVRYLAQAEGVEYAWAGPLLDDGATLRWRSASCPPTEQAWDPAVVAFRAVLTDDLWRRVQLPDRATAGTARWCYEGELDVEYPDRWNDDLWDLFDELSRRWLVWREEVVAAGLTDPEGARAALIARQRAWERTPHAGFDGRSPVRILEASTRGSSSSHAR